MRLVAAVCLALALAAPTAAEQIDYVETFAWAEDREAALTQLIPGTEQYYYYHCLHYQNTQRLEDAERMLEAWTARHGETASAQLMRNRQMLLAYADRPQVTLDYLRRSLDLQLDHQRKRVGEKPNLPGSLDPASISRDTLTAVALTQPNLDGFQASALRWLADTDLTDPRRRLLLSRLERPDYPGLAKLVAADLEYRDSGGFGSLAIHAKLTLAQLDELVEMTPVVRNNTHYVQAYVAKLRPSEDADWQNDPEAQRAYLERLWEFVSMLGPVHNSLKAHVLYHRLDFDVSQGVYDKERFLTYLRLPRNVGYINPRYLEQPEHLQHRADLSQPFDVTLLPPVRDDEPLVRRLFHHFFVEAADYEEYLPLVRTEYLKQVFAETKAVHGLGDPEQWASLLSPAAYQALKERVDLDFDPQNRKLFRTDEPVSLDLHIKNVEQLIVKVFYINTTSYSRQTLREVNTDIELDGLIPNQQQTVDYDLPPLRRVRRHFEFPELTKPGVYVIDFIGSGRSSRAVIRKGTIRHMVHTTPSGQAVVVLTEDDKLAEDAMIYFAGREHRADEHGVILLPFATDGGGVKPMVVHHGGQAYVRHIQHVPEQYSLTAGVHVERELLRSRGEAVVMLRPQLRLHGTPVSLALLEDVSLTIVSTNLDGVESRQHVKDLQLSNLAETAHRFQVPPRLQRLSFVLEGRVKPVHNENATPLTLSDSATYLLNEIATSDQVADVHLARTPEGYTIRLLGRTGEPLADRAVHVELQHRDFTQVVHAHLQTDQQGQVELGPLDEILWVAARQQNTGQRKLWQLDLDRASMPGNVHGAVGEPIEVPWSGGEVTRRRISLLEVRGGRYVSDRFDHVAAEHGMLRLTELPPGNYELIVDGQSIAVRVTEGPRVAGYALGDARLLQLLPAGPSLGSVEADDDELAIHVQDADPFTRVHVFSSRFMPAYSAWAAMAHGDAEPMLASAGPRRSLFVEGRSIGDEYEYILRRQFAAKYPGNMLSRPSLLLNPWALRSTETSTSSAAEGEQFGATREPAPPAPGEPPGRPGATAPDARSDFATLDWLHAGAVAANLRPDEQGRIRVPRDRLGGGQHVRVLLVHPRATVQRTAVLPLGGAKRADLRLADALDLQSHFVQRQQVAIVGKGETFTLRAIDSARFEPYDSLASVFGLYRTLSKDPKLDEFRFVLRWHEMEEAEKREKYSEYACHELHFYLLHKDPEFFRKVVAPYLANKRNKSFLDDWLLERSLTPYLGPWRHQELNIVERILIGRRIEGQQPLEARHVDELVALQPTDLARQSFLFETALQQAALAAGEKRELMSRLRELSRTASEPEPTSGQATDGAPDDPFGAAAPPAPGVAGPGTGGADTNGRNRVDAKSDSDRFSNGDAAGELSFGGKGEMGGYGGAMGGGGMGGGMGGMGDFGYLPGRHAGAAPTPLYQVLDKTQEWAENQYYKLPIEAQDADLVDANRFWQDYARHQDGPFLSKHLAEASGNFTECMLALAVLDLPPDAAEHETSFEGDTMRLTAGGPIVMFHEEISSPEQVDEETPILVSQNLFRADDRYRYEEQQRLDKYVTDEFLTHVVYGCQVVVTNPTSAPQKLDLLLQIPEGSLPLAGGKATGSVQVELGAFSTTMVEFLFYFPAVGEYPMFPAHVSRNETLVASAEARVLRVVESLSRVDRESWAYISQNGTEAEVLRFLRDANLQRLDLDEIAFRMHDVEFFKTVTGLLVERHAYSHTLWSYGVKHDLPPRIREFLQFEDEFVAQCGPYLDSPLLTIDPVVRKLYQHLDYRPLVNARRHQLGQQRRILNDRLHQQYHSLLKIHSFQPRLDDADRMAATYYLLLQERVEEGIEMFEQVNPQQLETTLQHDYFAAYISFYTGELQVARAMADKHSGHPVERWRDTFAAVDSQLREIDGAATEVIDPDNRDQRQTELADKSPSLQLKVEGGQVRIDYQNVQQATVNYYLMDIELLFSRNPFVQQFSGQFSHILPNTSQTLKLEQDRGTKALPLPEELNNQNVLVEVTAGGVTQTEAWYSNSLTVQLTERFGQLRVGGPEGQPLPKAYVKVFARMKDGQVKFYKDGYTDLRGRYDYSSLSTNELDNVQRFAILIMSDEHGSVVREAGPPPR